MRHSRLFTSCFFLLFFTSFLFAQGNFYTSLHYTREGKETAYKAANGGMELITNVPMDSLSCQKCHSTTGYYPNGNPINPATYVPSCDDCHDFSVGTAVGDTTCLHCHNRQKYERNAYPGMDAHQNYGLTCLSCHTKEEIHGDDGVAYSSLLEPGAIKVHCEDCHTNMPANTSHTVHIGKVECAACHAVSILSCASCHFETLLATGKNRAINQIKNYRLLVKKDGKVRLGSFMTHTYNGQTNYIIASNHSHIIQKNATTCSDCHYNMGGTNAAIAEYNNTGIITMTTWNDSTKKIIGPSGVVPIPYDWHTSLKMDYAYYTGDPNIFPSDPNAWAYLKSTTDNAHMFFAEPLDSATMSKLGFTRFPTAISDPGSQVTNTFALHQNYPNPFNPNTTIEFTLPKTENVSLSIFDINGRLLKKLIDNQNYAAGKHAVQWNGQDAFGQNVSSGIYFYRLKAGNFVKTKSMLMLK